MGLPELATAAVAAVLALIGAFVLGRRKSATPTPLPYTPPTPDPAAIKEREEAHRRLVERVEQERLAEEGVVIERSEDRVTLVNQPDQLDDFLKEVGNKARGE